MDTPEVKQPQEQAETAAVESVAAEDAGNAVQNEAAVETALGAIVEPVNSEVLQPEAEGESVEILPDEEAEEETAPPEYSDSELKAILEAVIYVTEEPLEAKQISAALRQPPARISAMLAELVREYARHDRGIQIKEIAGGYKMSTKPEIHDEVRLFVKNLKPPLKLSLAALETLAVIAYKQPITAPEIMEIRGVQGGSVLKTLLDRKLVAVAGRKNVIGKPILYKTTKDFLVQFGLSNLKELPSLKEFEELRRLAFSEEEAEAASEALAQRNGELFTAPEAAGASMEAPAPVDASKKEDESVTAAAGEK